jgi:hypothetical protein
MNADYIEESYLKYPKLLSQFSSRFSKKHPSKISWARPFLPKTWTWMTRLAPRLLSGPCDACGKPIGGGYKDTGSGIPEDVRDKLFTPLFTTKAKGQGFGLPVVKRMTEALGGKWFLKAKREQAPNS